MNGLRVGLTFSCLKFIAVGDALTIILSEPIWTLFLAKVNLVKNLTSFNGQNGDGECHG